MPCLSLYLCVCVRARVCVVGVTRESGTPVALISFFSTHFINELILAKMITSRITSPSPTLPSVATQDAR